MATDVLGRVIEVVSGQSLDEFLTARILRPLGMIDTGFYSDLASPSSSTLCQARCYIGEASFRGAARPPPLLDRPAEELTVSFFTQLLPSSTYPICSQLRQLVYQVIIS